MTSKECGLVGNLVLNKNYFDYKVKYKIWRDRCSCNYRRGYFSYKTNGRESSATILKVLKKDNDIIALLYHYSIH